jgi:hypothetical protein
VEVLGSSSRLRSNKTTLEEHARSEMPGLRIEPYNNRPEDDALREDKEEDFDNNIWKR